MRVRLQTIAIGKYIEDRQFELGWLEGRRCPNGAKSLALTIDSTVLTACSYEENTKSEALAGRPPVPI